MHTDEDITEITTLDATKVAGVQQPANRMPFILLKAKGSDHDADGDVDAEDKQTGAAFERNAGASLSDEAKEKFAQNAKRKKAKASKDADVTIEADEVDVEDADDEDAEKSSTDRSAEADEIKELVTGTAKASSYCGDPECEECVKAELVPLIVATAHASGVSKATLRAADRKKMSASSFAYVDPDGGKHLPIHDEGHVQAALGRFGQQDFSGAEDPDAAKRKAAQKIKRAAGKLGVEVDEKSDVAQAAKREADAAEKGEVQDQLQGTRMPEEGGYLGPARSGVAGPVTGDPKPLAASTSFQAGGASSYEIPAEQRLADSGPAAGVPNPPRAGTVWLDRDGDGVKLTAKSMAVASLVATMQQVEQQRRAAKDGGYLSVLGPTADQASAPGSMPWETYDAATLDQVATVLAACCNAIDAIATREQIEALNGDQGDYQDAWDLDAAADSLQYAMGVVARLAYTEGAEAAKSEEGSEQNPHLGAVEKTYRRLRATDEKALRDAHAAISNVLAEHDRKVADAGQDDNSNEEDKIQMELTKSEFSQAIVAGVQEILKAERKAAKKADKKAAKRAAKNANNNGDITAQQLKDGVNGETDADDVKSVMAAQNPKYVNKSGEESGAGEQQHDPALKSIEDQLKAVTESVGHLGEQVQKIAKRPRQGGPVLDGQARGTFPAAEARTAEVSKGSGDEQDQLIKSLEETFERAQENGARADIISDLGNQLTHARLVREHLAGRI